MKSLSIGLPSIPYDNSPCRYEVSVEDVVLCDAVRTAEGYNRMPPKNFFTEGTDVGKVFPIFVFWKPIEAHHFVKLLLSLSLGLGEKNHGEEEYMKHIYRLNQSIIILVRL